MRDEDGAHPLRRAAANDGKQTVPGLDIERRRRLVQDEYARVANQSARNAAGLTEGEAQLLHRPVRVEVLVDEVAKDAPNLLAPFGAGGRPGGQVFQSEPHVVHRGQRPDGQDLLEHRGDPVLVRGARGAERRQFVPGDPKRPGVGSVHAAEDLDQRALARAVLPHDGVNLAAAQVKRAVRQRPGGAERLAQMADRQRRGFSRGRPRFRTRGAGGVSHRRCQRQGSAQSPRA